MSNAILLVDTGNLYHNVFRRYPHQRINYSKLLQVIPEEYSLLSKTAYGAYRYNNTKALAFITALSRLNFVTKFERLESNKYYNPTVDMVLEAVTRSKDVDCVIFASTNPYLIPVVHWLKQRNISSCIIGCNISRDFCLSASKIIEINEAYLVEDKNEVDNSEK